MFCRNCGKEVPDNAKFCPWCRAPQQEGFQPSVPKTGPGKCSNRKGLIAIIGIAAVVCILIIVVIAAGSGRRSTPNSPSNRGTSNDSSASKPAPSEPEKPSSPESKPTAGQPSDQPTSAPANQSAVDQPVENLIKNGDFSDGLNGWGLYLEGGNGTIDVTSDKKLLVTVKDSGDMEWAVQVQYDGFTLKSGEDYVLEFEVYSDKNLAFTANIQENGGDYRAFGDAIVYVENGGGRVSISFTADLQTRYTPMLALNVGNMVLQGEKTPSGKYTLTFDNFKLYSPGSSQTPGGGNTQSGTGSDPAPDPGSSPGPGEGPGSGPSSTSGPGEGPGSGPGPRN